MTIAQPGSTGDAGDEMRRIIESIAVGDGAAAARASTTHVERTKRLAMAFLAREGAAVPPDQT